MNKNFDSQCPDANIEEFQYGLELIVEQARFGYSFAQSLSPPSDIKRELQHLDDVLGRLSVQARVTLDRAARIQNYANCLVKLVPVPNENIEQMTPDELTQFYNEAISKMSPNSQDVARLREAAKPYPYFRGHVESHQRLIRRAATSIKAGRANSDHTRRQLGMDAASLWLAHSGDINSDEFQFLIDELIDEMEMSSELGKSRIDAVALCDETRTSVKTNGAPLWELWERERNYYEEE
jgi:hypothetical protein